MTVILGEINPSFEDNSESGIVQNSPIEAVNDTNDDYSQIFISLHYENKKFGASIYENNEFKMLNEDGEGIHHDFMDMISLKESSLKFISSTRSNITAIKQCLHKNSTIQLVPAADFSLCTANSIQDSFGIITPHECLPDNEACFRSLKALIIHVSKMLPQNLLEEAAVTFLQIDSSNVVISKNCLQALQIFDFEPHPNMHAAQSGSKEGYSIFSLFNQVFSDEGRSKLKNWFHHPTNNIQILKSRHDSIEVLIRKEMSTFVKSVSKSLKKCIRISNVLTDLKFRPSAGDLLKIGKFCEAFQEIYMQTQEPNIIIFPVIETIKSFDFSLIFNLSRLIRKIINVDYNTSEIYTIRELISSDLDSLRRKYSNLPDFLTSVVSEIAQGIKSQEVEAVNIVYFPQLGFLITLPLPSNDIDPNQLGIQLGFQLQFQSDKICYFKNEKMRNLDESIGDVYADIIDAQLEIMQQVVNEAVSCEPLLKEALDICSELDCLLAFSKTAQTHELQRPEMVTDSSVLQIEDGRHLLVDIFTNNLCIANDCNLTPNNCKMIITGANSSGKSVYLKQVGIITFLAHIGSYVPAKVAKIGLVDRILTRIKTIESSGKGESCFMIDLKQVKGICETMTDRSLVLIDEFGKGTCQNDGMALFSGLLTFFSQKSMRLLAITHMHEIFQHNLIPNCKNLFKFSHMKVFPDKSGLCYLYRLEEGLCSEQSFAIECARESGIPEELLVKAKQIQHEMLNGASPEDLLLLKTNEQDLNNAIDLIKNSIVKLHNNNNN